AHQHLFVILFETAAAYIITELVIIIAAAQNGRIHLADVPHDVGSGVVRINPDGTFLQVEAGKFPYIFFHPRVDLGRKEVLKGDRTEGAAFYLRGQHTAAEFRGIDTHQLAEISRIDILHLCGCDHQIVENRVVEDGPAFPVKDDPAAGINAFTEKGVFLRLLFVFFGNDLQVEELGRDDQEHACENEADDITARLIEYRHMDLLLQCTH